MRFQPTALPEVVLVEPEVLADDRGFFVETFRAERFAAAGLPSTFVQDNHSHSRKGSLRGLHYQVGRPQAKLVRAVTGEVFDVAVDLRRSSPSFRRWVGVRLSAENHRQLLIPAGFAHGFLVLSEAADVLYKVTEPWIRDADRAVRWDDPEIGIEWPLDGAPLLSPRDAAAPGLGTAETYA